MTFKTGGRGFRFSVAVADLAARALLQRAQQYAPVRFYSARYRVRLRTALSLLTIRCGI